MNVVRILTTGGSFLGCDGSFSRSLTSVLPYGQPSSVSLLSMHRSSHSILPLPFPLLTPRYTRPDRREDSDNRWTLHPSSHRLSVSCLPLLAFGLPRQEECSEWRSDKRRRERKDDQSEEGHEEGRNQPRMTEGNCINLVIWTVLGSFSRFIFSFPSVPSSSHPHPPGEALRVGVRMTVKDDRRTERTGELTTNRPRSLHLRLGVVSPSVPLSTASGSVFFPLLAPLAPQAGTRRPTAGEAPLGGLVPRPACGA